jgi:hypothetical protein
VNLRARLHAEVQLGEMLRELPKAKPPAIAAKVAGKSTAVEDIGIDPRRARDYEAAQKLGDTCRVSGGAQLQGCYAEVASYRRFGFGAHAARSASMSNARATSERL